MLQVSDKGGGASTRLYHDPAVCHQKKRLGQNDGLLPGSWKLGVLETELNQQLDKASRGEKRAGLTLKRSNEMNRHTNMHTLQAPMITPAEHAHPLLRHVSVILHSSGQRTRRRGVAFLSEVLRYSLPTFWGVS
jgi:hypothetical protein